MEKPKTHNIKNPWELEQAVKDYLEFVDNDEEYNEDRLDNYKKDIFEKAMECFAGENIWDWVNNRQE